MLIETVEDLKTHSNVKKEREIRHLNDHQEINRPAYANIVQRDVF